MCVYWLVFVCACACALTLLLVCLCHVNAVGPKQTEAGNTCHLGHDNPHHHAVWPAMCVCVCKKKGGGEGTFCFQQYRAARALLTRSKQPPSLLFLLSLHPTSHTHTHNTHTTHTHTHTHTQHTHTTHTHNTHTHTCAGFCRARSTRWCTT